MNINKIEYIQMDILKKTIITVTSAILAFMQPVENAIYLLLFLFLVNLVTGIFHDIIINRDRFHFKKFIWACVEFLIYVGIVCGIYIIGHFQGDKNEAQYIIKVISYLFIYAYSTNILKNLLLIRPESIVLKFLYFIISLAFVKKIPYWAEFLKHNRDDNR